MHMYVSVVFLAGDYFVSPRGCLLSIMCIFLFSQREVFIVMNQKS